MSDLTPEMVEAAVRAYRDHAAVEIIETRTWECTCQQWAGERLNNSWRLHICTAILEAAHDAVPVIEDHGDLQLGVPGVDPAMVGFFAEGQQMAQSPEARIQSLVDEGVLELAKTADFCDQNTTKAHLPTPACGGLHRKFYKLAGQTPWVG